MSATALSDKPPIAYFPEIRTLGDAPRFHGLIGSVQRDPNLRRSTGRLACK